MQKIIQKNIQKNIKKNVLMTFLFLSFSTTSFGFDVLPSKVPVPKDNPISATKIALGKKLFMDPRLSADNTVSCNSCHNVVGKNASGTDNRPTSAGIKGQLGGRNSPTVWNAGHMSVQFWDGRKATLEDQAKGPITSSIEMGMASHDAVVEKLQGIAEYSPDFKKAFGTTEINIDRIAKAIATFERTLTTPNSPVDQYLKGKKKALTAAQVRGMKKVQEVGCLACHSGPMYAGPALPTGTGFYMKFPTMPDTEYDKKYAFSKDLGRYEATKNEADKNMFRVASWRNVALTAPYFHNGSVATLDEAVRVMAKTQLNRDLKDDEVSDIVEFLKGL